MTQTPDPMEPAGDQEPVGMYGHALALQLVTLLLHRLSATPDASLVLEVLVGNASQSPDWRARVAQVGCTWAHNFLTPLAVEMSLKALIKQERGKYSHKHQLDLLLDELPKRTRTRLESEYAQCGGAEPLSTRTAGAPPRGFSLAIPRRR